MIEIEAVPSETGLREVFGCFPTGVTAVCALGANGPVGMAVSSFVSVSVDPPLVSVCMQNTSETWRKLRDSPRLGLSVLAEGHDELCRKMSRKGVDRFADVAWEASDDGAIFIHDAAAWLDCSLESVFPAGDHVIALLRIHGLQADHRVCPLVFHASRFRRIEAA